LAKCFLLKNPRPYAITLNRNGVSVVAGFALLASYRDGDKLRLFMIDKDYQGMGLARPALNLVLSECNRNVYLSVDPINVHAQRLYRRVGFVRETEQKGFVYMKKSIN
jgi:RimJ/RimL family protein N-acetyltransferase